MLYNFNWLQPGRSFPPEAEIPRIERYKQNARLFDGDHFADPEFRSRNPQDVEVPPINLYLKCSERISQIVGNFDDIVSFPTLLNYQRLMSLKTADLVCGEYPTISGVTPKENEAIKDVRDESDFDSKLYSTVLDISRYGDAVWRVFKDFDGRMNFTCWDPCEWFPIVAQDGTLRMTAHCICWIKNESDEPDKPDYRLHVQIHSCEKGKTGSYEHHEYRMNHTGTTIGDLIKKETVSTGLDRCAVFHLRAFATSNSVYGYDDYMTVDSLLAEIMTRVGQISGILDKHADPNITGPVSMLTVDPKSGEMHLNTGKFFAVSPGEEQPSYMTWDGQLSSAFKQLETLLNQLYILSEMGAALLGGQDGSSQAISGTAMRFKMVNPLAKVRRIANSLSKPVRQLMSSLSVSAEVDESMFDEPAPEPAPGETAPEPKKSEPLVLPIPSRRISIFWADGLPDDPRENIENAKLATGETKMMPLEKAIMEFFGRSNEEALQWIARIREETAAKVAMTQSEGDDDDPNHPGPQDGKGVNTAKKGSTTGLNDFHGLNN